MYEGCTKDEPRMRHPLSCLNYRNIEFEQVKFSALAHIVSDTRFTRKKRRRSRPSPFI